MTHLGFIINGLRFYISSEDVLLDLASVSPTSSIDEKILIQINDYREELVAYGRLRQHIEHFIYLYDQVEKGQSTYTNLIGEYYRIRASDEAELVSLCITANMQPFFFVASPKTVRQKFRELRQTVFKALLLADGQREVYSQSLDYHSTIKRYNPSKIYTETEIGYVYLFLAEFDHNHKSNIYKIGKSKDPERRRKEVRGTNPFELIEIHRIFTNNMSCAERSLHEFFGDKRKDRGEWFQFENDEVELIKSVDELQFKWL